MSAPVERRVIVLLPGNGHDLPPGPHTGGPEMHVYSADGSCNFLDAAGVRCLEDHRRGPTAAGEVLTLPDCDEGNCDGESGWGPFGFECDPNAADFHNDDQQTEETRP